MTRRNYALDFEIARRTDPLTKRDVRALTQGHSISNAGGDGEFIVESHGSGNEYTVDLRRGACDCPDADSDGSTICKHQRAAQFATGMRPIPTVALELDEIAVDVIRDPETNVVDLDAVDDYTQIRLETDANVARTPRWATDDGEIVDAVATDDASEHATADELADIRAERELVHEQEPEQQAAADGGQDDEIARCGSTDTASSEPCENPVSDAERCHLHRDDGDDVGQEQAEPEISVDASSDADAALANAATDGGAVIASENTSDVLDRVLEHADDRPIVVVVAN